MRQAVRALLLVTVAAIAAIPAGWLVMRYGIPWIIDRAEIIAAIGITGAFVGGVSYVVGDVTDAFSIKAVGRAIAVLGVITFGTGALAGMWSFVLA